MQLGTEPCVRPFLRFIFEKLCNQRLSLMSCCKKTDPLVENLPMDTRIVLCHKLDGGLWKHR